MKELNRKRVWDLGMTAIALLVIITMIVPVTPVIMDILISLNFAVAALIFSASMLFANPVKFSVFPSLLLLSTLYRLALNISSTRLILTKGDAGNIIGGFGGFVVGGDIIVGAIIFIIITMVLFLVITKGAE
ncbi:MAG: FHIPEP family type III secretion protein, partial [Deltaproteobacteria bacterium]|nr:FHIPEP family type III secretion protein [Deltaproteobacteria bacterium]